jgi:hypothetical protein
MIDIRKYLSQIMINDFQIFLMNYDMSIEAVS